jgi:APA family basic amino acid/polyamine antiporter
LALVIQCAVAMLLVLVGGAFQELFSLAIFAEWLFYMVAASTIFVFRKREREVHRPYRTAGYPVVPIVFIATAAVLLCYTFVSNLRNSMGGVLVILLGIPVYYWFARSKRKREQPNLSSL